MHKSSFILFNTIFDGDVHIWHNVFLWIVDYNEGFMSQI